ncbi:cyclin-D-binding Myb-like transcription factor 1 isoform X1 [Ixodes scapularis]
MVMDLTRVVTVAVQSDPLSSHDLDGDMIASMSPCQDALMMGACDSSCLTDDSIEEVVVVADNSSNSLSGLGSLDSEGSSEVTLAPSYFLAPCGEDGSPDKPAFEQEPTLILAPHSLCNDHDSLQEEPISFSPMRFNEGQSEATATPTVQTDINQNWFTSKEDKSSLQSKGHSWKQGMFSKEETEILEENIQKYCEARNISSPATVIFSMTKEERKDFYRTIAKGLNRPLFSVYRRVIRMYDNKNHIGKYSSEELDQLKALRAAHGNDWRLIGNALGRSAASIKDRCRLMKENCRQGVWLPAEERRLAEAVYDLSGSLPGEIVTSGLSWTQVAERVASRSEKQCRTKWLNYLNWKEAGGTLWTREDDITLISTVYTLGVSEETMIDWTEFAKDWSSVRSPQWLRGKWWSLKRNVPNANKMTFLEICEYLYKNYGQRMQFKDDVSKATTSSVTLVNGDACLGARLQPKAPSVPLVSSVRLLNSTSALTVQPTAPTLSVATALSTALQSISSTPITLTTTEGGGILEVIPQNFQLPATSQTILLTTPGQGGIPIATTSLPQGQIIIQTLPAEPLESTESLLVQMNLAPRVIVNSDSEFLSSPQEADCPAVSLDTSEIDASSYAMCCIDGEEFEVQEIHDTSSIDEVDESSLVTSQMDENCVESVILSDPMLAGSPEMLGSASDLESEKSHVVDSLDVVPEDT